MWQWLDPRSMPARATFAPLEAEGIGEKLGGKVQEKIGQVKKVLRK
jgi:hypothetical protein